jgi:hypothetical protein
MNVELSEVDADGWVHVTLWTSYGHEVVRRDTPSGGRCRSVQVELVNLCEAQLDDEEAHDIVELKTPTDVPMCTKCISRVQQNVIIANLEGDLDESDS